jgi:hypothetical protein
MTKGRKRAKTDQTDISNPYQCLESVQLDSSVQCTSET